MAGGSHQEEETTMIGLVIFLFFLIPVALLGILMREHLEPAHNKVIEIPSISYKKNWTCDPFPLWGRVKDLFEMQAGMTPDNRVSKI